MIALFDFVYKFLNDLFETNNFGVILTGNQKRYIIFQISRLFTSTIGMPTWWIKSDWPACALALDGTSKFSYCFRSIYLF